MSAEPKRYATLDDLHREHRSGWAVKHEPHALFDDVSYWTWHRVKDCALSELHARGGLIADERYIPVRETQAWWMERARIQGLRRERRRNRRPGSGGRLRIV